MLLPDFAGIFSGRNVVPVISTSTDYAPSLCLGLFTLLSRCCLIWLN